MITHRKINLIGASIDTCSRSRGSADTPQIIKSNLQNLGLQFSDIHYYHGEDCSDLTKLSKYFTTLARDVKKSLQQSELPIIIGGDHSCAIGTWSGVSDSLQCNNETLGIIWIDAHMDSHTHETTITGNIHGMPVASLLGYGYQDFVNILHNNPKVNPENIILMGVRSYEEGEALLLKNLGVKVYYNHDISEHGFNKILFDSWDKLITQVDQIGLSIDLDGFDPEFVAGVGTKEPDGINFDEFLLCLEKIDIDKVVAVEIAEGNHHLDLSGKTMRCIMDIVTKIKQRLDG